MLSRRSLIGKLAAGAAVSVAWTASVARVSAASARSDSNAPTGTGLASTPGASDLCPPGLVSGPPPWELLRPLTLGAVVAHGWRVTDLTGVVDGACVLTLRNQPGRTHRIHLCRNDGRPQGLVYTERVDLVVMNGGQGDLPTDEGLAQAVAAVAHVLAANEGERQHAGQVAALLPHAERLRQFAAADARLR
jgi:hypothetical protein